MPKSTPALAARFTLTCGLVLGCVFGLTACVKAAQPNPQASTSQAPLASSSQAPRVAKSSAVASASSTLPADNPLLVSLTPPNTVLIKASQTGAQLTTGQHLSSLVIFYQAALADLGVTPDAENPAPAQATDGKWRFVGTYGSGKRLVVSLAEGDNQVKITLKY
ncbi:MAG: hypothetical protein LBG70_03015 [Bifidobacteriaceae bacterium]|jgi:hypothetical protein|nr:hypothetical protein [Bifidobacteriaceae bacterium]